MSIENRVKTVRDALRTFNRRAGVLKSDPYGIGLSLSQSSALVDIARFGCLRPNDLVRLLHLEKSSVSRLVGLLVSGGYIKIETDMKDKRSKSLTLTKSGKKTVDVINSVSNASVLEALRLLSKDDQEELVTAFTKLANAVRQLEES